MATWYALFESELWQVRWNTRELVLYKGNKNKTSSRAIAGESVIKDASKAESENSLQKRDTDSPFININRIINWYRDYAIFLETHLFMAARINAKWIRIKAARYITIGERGLVVRQIYR